MLTLEDAVYLYLAVLATFGVRFGPAYCLHWHGMAPRRKACKRGRARAWSPLGHHAGPPLLLLCGSGTSQRCWLAAHPGLECRSRPLPILLPSSHWPTEEPEVLPHPEGKISGLVMWYDYSIICSCQCNQSMVLIASFLCITKGLFPYPGVWCFWELIIGPFISVDLWFLDPYFLN